MIGYKAFSCAEIQIAVVRVSVFKLGPDVGQTISIQSLQRIWAITTNPKNQIFKSLLNFFSKINTLCLVDTSMSKPSLP